MLDTIFVEKVKNYKDKASFRTVYKLGKGAEEIKLKKETMYVKPKCLNDNCMSRLQYYFVK